MTGSGVRIPLAAPRDLGDLGGFRSLDTRVKASFTCLPESGQCDSVITPCDTKKKAEKAATSSACGSSAKARANQRRTHPGCQPEHRLLALKTVLSGNLDSRGTVFFIRGQIFDSTCRRESGPALLFRRSYQPRGIVARWRCVALCAHHISCVIGGPPVAACPRRTPHHRQPHAPDLYQRIGCLRCRHNVRCPRGRLTSRTRNSCTLLRCLTLFSMTRSVGPSAGRNR